MMLALLLIVAFVPEWGASASASSPVAVAGGSYVITEGGSVSLDASESRDPEFDPLRYAWDLTGDGRFDDARGVAPVVEWSVLRELGIDDDGVFPVSVRVDDGTSTSTADTTLTVLNAPPAIAIVGVAKAEVNMPFTISASAEDPGDDEVTEWLVSWGDGQTTVHTGATLTVSHTYRTPGLLYGVMIAATDDDGVWTGADIIVARDSGTLERSSALDSEAPWIELAGTVAGPSAMVFGPDGLLYVASSQSNSIARYDLASDEFASTFVAPGSGGLRAPGGLGFGPDGHLYVTSSETDQVLRYDGTTGAFIDVFIEAALSKPTRMLFAPDGSLYVLDADAVLAFDARTGVARGVTVTFPSGAGAFDLAPGPDAGLYVALADGVVHVDPGTGEVTDRAFEGDPAGAPGLRLGPDETLWMIPSGLRYDPTRGEPTSNRNPEGVDVRAIGLVADHHVLVTGPREIAVDSVADTGDSDPGDGICDTARRAPAATECTLRAAMEEANASRWAPAITFALPEGERGPADRWWTIRPADEPLPPITGAAVLDGTTQPGFAGTPLVVIDGSSLERGDGLSATREIEIGGVAVVGFAGDGIRLDGTDSALVDSFTGLLPDGAEAGNGGSGVVIGPQAVSSVISTSIISGNGGNGITAEADGLRITGNHIGTDQDGTAARGNGKAGVVLNGVSGAMVGAPGASNVISGNGADGIVVRGGSSLVTIQANLIGVARDRVTPLGNSPAAPFEGIDIQSATGVIVGGTGAGEGNTITGGGEGISVKPGAEAAILGNSIHGNTNLAVDLGDNPGSPSDGVTDNDPNDGWTNHPTLTRVTASQGIVTVEFDVHDVPGSYRVEFFANPSGRDLSGHGEAEVLIGGVTVDGPGSKYTFSYEGAVGDVISGASTRIRDGVFVSTSEMSLSVEVGQPSAPLSRTLDAR